MLTVTSYMANHTKPINNPVPNEHKLTIANDTTYSNGSSMSLCIVLSVSIICKGPAARVSITDSSP